MKFLSNDKQRGYETHLHQKTKFTKCLGIGGTAAALVLSQRGHNVTLLEAAPEVSSSTWLLVSIA